MNFWGLVKPLTDEYGLLGILILILLLLVHNPERAIQLKVLIIRPFFSLFKWGSKQYIGTVVAYQTTYFINQYVTCFLSGQSEIDVKIRWVTSPSDPIFSKDGTVLLRLRETTDQNRNILNATRALIPVTVCPELRANNIDDYAQTAIDLALLRKLAAKLGRNARALFQLHFLGSETEDDERARALFMELVELDKTGLFVAIFLEELEYLGERVFASGDTLNKTHEIIAFVKHLLVLARRERGGQISLDHDSDEFKVGTILVGISERTRREGVTPYMNRLTKDLLEGCESVYLIALHPRAFPFFKRLLKAITEQGKVLIKKEIVLHVDLGLQGAEVKEEMRLALVRKNGISLDEAFDERLKASGIKEGGQVEGVVTEVSPLHALVDVEGLDGHVNKKECSWSVLKDCVTVLSIGDRRQFVVKTINRTIGTLELSLRLDEEDPWQIAECPDVGEVVEAEVSGQFGKALVCRLSSGLEVYLPMVEISWFPEADKVQGLVGSKQQVLVYEVIPENRTILCSLRRLENDPWPELHKCFSPGTEITGKVCEVNPHFVRVEIDSGLTAIIPKECMTKAGYEYADYEQNIVEGQGLEVVVTKVFIKKRKIRVDLRRNVESDHTT